MRFFVFKKYPDLIYGISQKRDGSMKFFNLKIERKIRENREKFFKKIGVSSNQIISVDLIHGKRIKVVNRKDIGRIIKRTDGLITKDKNLYLTITVADCFPVYFYDPLKKVVALVHVGWRGLVKGIIDSVIIEMRKKFNCRPKNILAAVGPGIQKCHFEIKEDILNQFTNYQAFIYKKNKNNEIFVDLPSIIKIHLLKLGFKSSNIEISKDCTFCLKNKYFSYRRDQPQYLKTMIAFIGLKN